MSPAIGHEGWFSPDGMTYYMSTTGADGAKTVFPVDISDPTEPELLAMWGFQSQTHGGSTTEDGTRSYICQQQAPPKDKLLIVDTSEVAAREPDPQPRLLAEIPLDDNQWCQAAYRVTYDGHPFLIQYGERSGAADCSRSQRQLGELRLPAHLRPRRRAPPQARLGRAARGRPAAALRRGHAAKARSTGSATASTIARPTGSTTRRSSPAPGSARACGCSTSATRTTRSRSATTTPA